MSEAATVAGRSVLITGASRGLGRALCSEAAGRGYRVHALVRNPGSAPAGTTEHVADIRDREAVRDILRKLAPELGVFLANVGVNMRFDPRKDDCADQTAELFEINGTATAFALCAMAREWVRTSRRGVRLAVVSSLAAGRGLPRAGAYCATKMSELVLCQSLEQDLRDFGIGVSVIQPGFIATDMTKGREMLLFLLTAEQAARRVWDGLEAGKFKIAFPMPMRCLTWLMNVVPYPLFRVLMNMARKRKLV